MSRPNTRKKLRDKIVRVFLREERELSTDEITRFLHEDAAAKNYPKPDYYKIRETLGALCRDNLLEQMEPAIPRDAHIPGNRELQIMWAHYVKYRIPALTRLAMLANGDGE